MVSPSITRTSIGRVDMTASQTLHRVKAYSVAIKDA
jgi:hypothetical protein